VNITAPQRVRIAELAIQHRLPSMFIYRQYVEVGGLMSYGVDGRPIGARLRLSLRSCREPLRPICRLSRSRISNLLSTSRLRRPSALHYQRRSCCAPTYRDVGLRSTRQYAPASRDLQLLPVTDKGFADLRDPTPSRGRQS